MKNNVFRAHLLKISAKYFVIADILHIFVHNK